MVSWSARYLVIGSPGLTVRVRMVPTAGARMIDSVPEMVSLPLRVRSRFCSALVRATWARSYDSLFASTSDFGRTPDRESCSERW